MHTLSSRLPSLTRHRALPPAASQAFAGSLSRLYALSQQSQHVFGSPLGPFFYRGRQHSLPRFVYFGPQTHDDSLRLAFLAGFDARDLRTSLSLLHVVQRVVEVPQLGQGLNLSFFPLVDVLGLDGSTNARGLSEQSWDERAAPELALLQQDARLRGYHGFVRVEETDSEAITVRLRHEAGLALPASGVELIASDDFGRWPVRFEADHPGAVAGDGPLSLSDDLPLAPFELTLKMPDSWTQEEQQDALSFALHQFILRHRAHHAYGLHL